MKNSSLIYHDKYGLLSIGGVYQPSCYIMDMNIDGNHKNLKWKKTEGEILPRHSATRDLGYSHALLLNDDESKLFVIGGVDHQIVTQQKWLRMVDFDTDASKHWQKMANMNYCKADCGAFYDKVNHKIYVGGGNGWTGNDVTKGAEIRREYYDVHKNKWYQLPDTDYEHYMKACIWIEKDDPNLLYITSFGAGKVECIDLRMAPNDSSAKGFNIDAGFGNVLNMFGLIDDPNEESTSILLK